MAHTAHSATIPGEIVTSDGRTIPVSITDLTTSDCRIAVPLAPQGGTLELWLGAIGPFHIAQSMETANRLVFLGDIHPSIVRHFRAVQSVGWLGQTAVGSDFDDYGGAPRAA